MKHPKPRLTRRILVHVGCTFALLFIALSVFFCHRQNLFLRHDAVREYVLRGYSLGRDVSTMPLNQEGPFLEEAFQKAYEEMPGMLYFFFYDARGALRAFSEETAASRKFHQELYEQELSRTIPLLSFEQAAIQDRLFRCSVYELELPLSLGRQFFPRPAPAGSPVFDMAWEILSSGGEVRGRYHLGFSTAGLWQKARDFFAFAALLLLFLLGGALLFLRVILRNLTEPLENLTGEIVRIHADSDDPEEVEHRLEESRIGMVRTGSRELEQLKEAFLELRQMLLLSLHRLKKQSREMAHSNMLLKRYSQTLESRVQKRTELLEEKNLQLQEEIQERQEVEKQLRQLAVTDPLTKLRNRRYINQMMRRMEENRTPFALVLLDIDDFKHINDHYGHDGGDEALRHLGSLLQAFFQPHHTVARYGGEEFLILLPETSAEEAEIQGEQLRQRIEKARISFGEEIISLTVSVGIALCTPPLPAERGVTAADHALYEAKARGKNRVVVAEKGAGSASA